MLNNKLYFLYRNNNYILLFNKEKYILIITEKIRIYPNKSQKDLIDRYLYVCKTLYNIFLELNIQEYKSNQKFLWKFDLIRIIKSLSNRIDMSGIYSQVLQDVAGRLDYALHRMKTGNKFPKFKSFNQYRSFTYPQATGFGVFIRDGLLRLGKFGKVKAKFTRDILQDQLKTCIIKKMKSGKYYAFIAREVPEGYFPIQDVPDISVGIDLGVSKFLTTSDGHYVQSPRFLRKKLKKLARAQRELNRKKKGSNNRKKQIKVVARLHEKIADTRRDFHFKVAHWLTNNYGHIVCEDLEVSRMFKNKNEKKQRRALLDLGLGSFLVILEHMCNKYQRGFDRVPPEYTSQICSQCGTIVKKDLSVRQHVCPQCGLSIDRDLNAALNILNKKFPVGTTGGTLKDVPTLVETNVPGVSVYVASPQIHSH